MSVNIANLLNLCKLNETAGYVSKTGHVPDEVLQGVGEAAFSGRKGDKTSNRLSAGPIIHIIPYMFLFSL